MDTRYHIEEMVSQDARGVVFQGVDSVTGVVVAMRRFLTTAGENDRPAEKQRKAYDDAVAVMKKVSHPSLRRVLAGGCDSVDGMPYLVTRWAEGFSLRDVVSVEGALGSDLVLQMLGQLLNANTTLCKALEHEGLWLEATLDSVIVKPPRDENEPPTALFWVCPWRWLDAGTSESGIIDLADFAEAMLGGPRKIAAEPPGGELPKWIQRIRNKEITCLREAQESLKVPGSTESPFVLDAKPTPATSGDGKGGGSGKMPARKQSGMLIPAKPGAGKQVTAAARPSPDALNSPPGGRRSPAVAVAAVLLVLIAVVGWLFFNKQASSTAVAAEATDAQQAPPRSSSNQAKIDEMMSQIQGNSDAAEESGQQVERRRYHTIEGGDLLLAGAGQEATLRGRLAQVRFSDSGLTMYLEFSDQPSPEEPRAYAMTRDLVAGIHANELETLLGKQIEIRGEVDIENVSQISRPRIRLHSRDQITEIQPEADYELR